MYHKQQAENKNTVPTDIYVCGNAIQPGNARPGKDFGVENSSDVVSAQVPPLPNGKSVCADPYDTNLTGTIYKVPEGTELLGKRGKAKLEQKYSKQWLELVCKREGFEKACFNYNKLDKNIRGQDLRRILKESDLLEQLSVLKMMGEGYIFSDSIELVIDEIVEIAITGHEECAGMAVIALNHLNMKKWKDKIIQLVFFITDKELPDKEIFHYSWILLYKLGFKEALIKYIDRYNNYLDGEFDEDDLQNIANMSER